eukprot:scaffold113331_cov113-Phaeocystis_antarctica.AAC.1
MLSSGQVPHSSSEMLDPELDGLQIGWVAHADDPEGTRGRVGHANLAFGHRSHRRPPCAGDTRSTKRRADGSEQACVRAGPEVGW